jgi:hypothetical protein
LFYKQIPIDVFYCHYHFGHLVDGRIHIMRLFYDDDDDYDPIFDPNNSSWNGLGWDDGPVSFGLLLLLLLFVIGFPLFVPMLIY